MQNIECFYRVSMKALVRNEEGKILLNKDEHGKWDFPGGGMDHGESAREALARELQEEMGVELADMNESPSFVTTSQSIQLEGLWIMIIVYEAKLNGDGLDFTPSSECVEAGYFTPEEALKLDLYPGVDTTIQKLV